MTLANLARTETLEEQVVLEIHLALARRRQNQAGLARAMGVPAMWVSDRLSGKTKITVNDLGRIAEAIGITIADLLPKAQREVTVTDPIAPLFDSAISLIPQQSRRETSRDKMTARSRSGYVRPPLPCPSP